MRLVLIDQNLVSTDGHHAVYDHVICSEANRRKIPSFIICNSAFGDRSLNGIPVLPLLSSTCYDEASNDTLFASFDNIELVNQSTFQDLCKIPPDLLQGTDLVMFPTVNHLTLLGVVSWLASIPEARRPSVCIQLMFPSGVTGKTHGKPFIHDPAAALGYRQAWRVVKEARLDITFLATGHQIAEGFSILFKAPVGSHALISSFDQMPTVAAPNAKVVLLSAGAAKINKGLALLPEVIGRLLPQYPKIRFVLHANPSTATAAETAVLSKIKDMASAHPNLDLRLSGLSAAEYVNLISSAGVTLLPYDPVEYAHKSSGVAWEAISAGSVLVATAGTWLAAEARHLGAAYEPFSPYTAKSIIAALKKALEDLPQRQELALQAAERFRATNGVKLMFDQIADHWAQNAARLGIRTFAPFSVPFEDIGNDDWLPPQKYAGLDARWSNQSPSVPVSFPAPGNWRVTLLGPHLYGPEQAEQAVLHVDGQSLPTTGEMVDVGWQVSAVFTETAIEPPQRQLQLVLPWTHKRPNDPWQYGVMLHRIDISPEDAPAPDQTTRIEGTSANLDLPSGAFSTPLTYAALKLRADPRHSCVLSFDLPATTSPEAARDVAAFLNGQVLAVEITKEDDWRGRILLPARDLRAAFTHDIDLVFGTAVRLRITGISQRDPMATAGYTPPRPSSPATIGQPLGMIQWSPKRQTLPPLHPPSSAYDTSTTVDYEAVAIVELHDSPGFRFLNMSLKGGVINGVDLGLFYFKLLQGDEFIAIELREHEGAFQLLDQVSGASLTKDKHDRCIKIFFDREGNRRSGPLWQLAKNTTRLSSMLAALPVLVKEAAKTFTKTPLDLFDWETAAKRIARTAMAERNETAATKADEP